MQDSNSNNKNIAFLFPGVGSQYSGMGKDFYSNFKIVQENFEEASDSLAMNMCDICFNPEEKNTLDKLEYAKPSLVCLSTAIFRLLDKEIGVIPKFCLGHSLGEYSALTNAGGIEFWDVLKIVQERALIINEVSNCVEGTMAWIVNLNAKTVEDVCQDFNKDAIDGDWGNGDWGRTNVKNDKKGT